MGGRSKQRPYNNKRFSYLSRTYFRPMIPMLAIALALFLCGTNVKAQTGAVPLRYSVLPNGVRLILKPESDSQVVSIVAFIRTEPATTPEENAAAELVSRALFFGSVNRSLDRIARSVAQVGGVLETLRTPDYVAITCVTMNSQLNEAIYLLCEALKNAEFAPEALSRAYLNWLAQRRKNESDSFNNALDALSASLEKAPEPEESLLHRVTQAQAQSYFRRRYLPAHTVISVVGRFRPEEAAHAFDNGLFDYERKNTTMRAAMKEPEKLDFLPINLTFSTSSSAAYALTGVAAPNVASPDYPAFTVLHTLLGGGHASRLFRRVRDTLGVGYEVGAAYQPDHAGPLVAYLQWDSQRTSGAVKPPSSSDALRLLNAQLDAVLTDPPTENELVRARNVAIGRDALRHERVRQRAFFLGWYEAMGLGYGFDAEFPRRLAAVTPADVLRVAGIYLKNRSTAVVSAKLRSDAP